MRRSPLSRRSPKTEVLYVDRRSLVEAAMDAHPLCELCGMERSHAVHERLYRSRGGDINDPVQSGQIVLGFTCHRRAHVDRDFCRRWGLAWHSWDSEPAPMLRAQDAPPERPLYGRGVIGGTAG